MSENHIYTLSNGLRLVCKQRKGTLVSYIGVAINAGSRDEKESCQGLAHFVEHTIFKGTTKRKGWQVSNRMESVGGELNAYTSKEETMLYTTSPSGYEERAIELLADLIAGCRFPPEEIEREKGVVIEEINSYLDSPSEHVFDEFEEHAYKGSAIAHNILGTPESVASLTSASCREFIDRHYTPGNMVAYCVSPQTPEKIYKLIEKYFLHLDFPLSVSDRVVPPPMEPFDIVNDNDAHQANTILGSRTFPRTDSRRFSLFLLNNYFGGPGMNSILYRELREKRGLVYAVDSSVGLLSDTGMWFLYFACEAPKIDKCLGIIHNELDRLCQSPVSAKRLESMKRQYCGQLQVSSDHTESRAMAMAKSLIYFDKVIEIETTMEKIQEVSAEDLLSAARLLQTGLQGRLTLR